MLMKFSRRQTFAALGATLAMPYVRPSWAQSAVVNVYNWADYIGETTLEDFEKATGIAVSMTPIRRLRRCRQKCLPEARVTMWLIMSGWSMPQFITAGIYQKLDKSKLPSGAISTPTS
jgi:putrescine transport system substrate-binding protein